MSPNNYVYVYTVQYVENLYLYGFIKYQSFQSGLSSLYGDVVFCKTF